MKTFLIKTQGCKSNQLEASVVREKLLNAGYSEVFAISDADVYILNSCSVTEVADIDALRILRNVKHKKNNIFTVLTGCSAQLNSSNLESLDYVDLILGNNDKFDIVEAISSKNSLVTDIFSVKAFNNQFVHDYSKTRGYLKIQDGCNNYCSYCTIPLARGNSRSNSISNILEQIKLYTDAGIKEIVLTGIHIGQWGADLSDDLELFNLLEAIETTSIERYRLGSLNTLEINDVLLDFLSQSRKFCPHFHLSLQSLNDKILSLMNRKYSAQSCLDLMDKITESFELPFIGSDIIVGFPDETSKDFELTLNNAKKSKLSNIHVFPYSVRNNTKAATMQNQVADNEKQIRASLLREVASEKYKHFVESNIGTEVSLLIEKILDKKTSMLKGVTPNYLNVLLNSSDSSLCNTIQQVKILSFDNDFNTLKARIIT